MNTITIRNTTLGDGRPKICIPVTAGTQAELWEQAEKKFLQQWLLLLSMQNRK